MSNKRNGVKWSKNVPARSRRARVLDMLNEQLKRGNKPSKEGMIALTDKDIARIGREITTLKTRL